MQLLIKENERGYRQDAFYYRAYSNGFPFCSSHVLGIDYELEMNINSYSD